MVQQTNDRAETSRVVGSNADFERFLAQFDTVEFRREICSRSGLSAEAVEKELTTYFGEMRFGHAFLAERMPSGRLRILEVGAGLGLLSLYLAELGHDVTALEPAALSFEFFAITKQLVWELASGPKPDLIETGAEMLDPDKHGQFDFIFSINVMEHIENLDDAFAAMVHVTAPDGVGLHSCPNYMVPYEPHFAIPLVPFSPRLSRRLFAAKIDKNPDLWDSFNFITASRVRAMSRRYGASVSFEKAVTYKSFARLAEDETFVARHRGGIVGRAFSVLSTLRLLGLLKLLPTGLNTPMIFEVRKGKR